MTFLVGEYFIVNLYKIVFLCVFDKATHKACCLWVSVASLDANIK